MELLYPTTTFDPATATVVSLCVVWSRSVSVAGSLTRTFETDAAAGAAPPLASLMLPSWTPPSSSPGRWGRSCPAARSTAIRPDAVISDPAFVRRMCLATTSRVCRGDAAFRVLTASAADATAMTVAQTNNRVRNRCLVSMWITSGLLFADGSSLRPRSRGAGRHSSMVPRWRIPPRPCSLTPCPETSNEQHQAAPSR